MSPRSSAAIRRTRGLAARLAPIFWLLSGLWACDCSSDSSPASQPNPQAAPSKRATSPEVERAAQSPPARNARCRAPRRPDPGFGLALQTVFEGPELNLGTRARPLGKGAWLFAQLPGLVRRIEASGDSRVVLDIRERVKMGGQWGLLDILPSPGFARDRILYVTYTTHCETPTDKCSLSRLSRFTLGDGPAVAREEVLIEHAGRDVWHPVAGMEWGPDGLLYVGWGESSMPPAELREDGGVAGKILRIDVRKGARRAEGRAYAIPGDNPFATGPGRPEVFARGLRNPWRMSFDRESGALFVGDVGSHLREEINRVRAGADYGWPSKEGSRCRHAGQCDADSDRFTDPLVEHTHAEVCSVTGGHVYRGAALPALRGKYLYGSYCSGAIWGIAADATEGQATPQVVLTTDKMISSFAEDSRGELYVLGFALPGLPRRCSSIGDPGAGIESCLEPRPGGLYRLVPREDDSQAPVAVRTAPTPELPQKLSGFGCFETGGTQPAAGVVAYDVNIPQWAAGAEVEHALSLPFHESYMKVYDDGVWAAPALGVVLQTFRIDGKPVETRVLAHHHDGGWGAYSYAWAEDGSDATLVDEPSTRTLSGGRTWRFMGAAQCKRCHTPNTPLLGLKTQQLNRPVEHGEAGVNQLTAFEDMQWVGLARDPPYPRRRAAFPDGPDEAAAFPAPADDSAPVEARVRAYLDAQCSHCHRPGGPAPFALDLRAATPLAQTGLCNGEPSVKLPELPNGRHVVPGHPERSVIVARVGESDWRRMPPLGNARPDPAFVALLRTWIEQGACADAP